MTQIIISGFSRSRAALWADWRILLVYLIQSAFEGAIVHFHVHVDAGAVGVESEDGDGGRDVGKNCGRRATDDCSGGAAERDVLLPVHVRYDVGQQHLNDPLSAIPRRGDPAQGVFALGAAVQRHHLDEVTYTSFMIFKVLFVIDFPTIGTMRASYLTEENSIALLTFTRAPQISLSCLPLTKTFTPVSFHALRNAHDRRACLPVPATQSGSQLHMFLGYAWRRQRAQAAFESQWE